MALRWLCLVVLVGCLQPGDVPCGDRICPANTVCEASVQLCVPELATTICQGMAERAPCRGPGFVGLCQDGVCLPGCGDGKINQAAEGCDDANLKSHDGCSSACLVEVASWLEQPELFEPTQNHAAGYHKGNNFLVVVTGQSLEGLRNVEWSARYDPASWFFSTTATMPSPRIGATMAYDAARQKLVLFGGGTGAMFFNDTWEWSYNASDPEHSWVHVTPTASPPARQDGTIVFDTVQNRIVLFGGQGPNGYLDDTWEYDGTTWVENTTTAKPPKRALHAMAFDDTRKRTVLVAGIGVGDQYLGDVWEYDGSAWSQAATPAFVGKRAGASMQYAPDRGAVILFGGILEEIVTGPFGDKTLRTPTSDTLSYNGSAWSRVSTTYAPPARSLSTLTPAPPPQSSGSDLDELYLIGGAQGGGKPPLWDVWRLSPTGWVDYAAPARPSARYGAPAIFDDRTGAVHIFGGFGFDVLQDVWSFVEIGWRPADTTGSFASIKRYYHTAAYDIARDRIVMFGGLDATHTVTSTTFENAGDNQFVFETKSPATSPPARQQGVMAYDGTTVVLFGGLDGSGAILDDTWTYDGTTWTKDTSSNHPAASEQAAAAYDEKNKRLVLFDAAGKTWTHAPSGWTELPLDPASSPGPRDRAAMTFDWTTKHVLLVGGQAASGPLDEVWELEDTGWRRLNVAGTSPLPRFAYGLTADLRTRDVTLIGGASSGNIPYGDIWTFQRRSATPDEDCMNGEDDDGDGRRDVDDPDCCSTADQCLTP